MTLKNLWLQNKIYFIGFSGWMLAAIIVLLTTSKKEGFYLLNTFHTPELTFFFVYATFVGDGFFCILVGLLFILMKERIAGLLIIVSYLFSGALAQIIKYFVIEPRPGILFKDTDYPYFIQDVTLHNVHAFPSGHTASAFALATILSFWVKNKSYSSLFLIIAIIVAYSRIYLAQHFLQDVLAGAVIGVLSAILCCFLFSLVNRKYQMPCCILAEKRPKM